MRRSKWIVGLVAGIMAISLIACGKNQNVANNGNMVQGESEGESDGEQIQVDPGVAKLPKKITHYDGGGDVSYLEEFEYDSNNNIIKYKATKGDGIIKAEFQWDETEKNVVREIRFSWPVGVDGWYEHTYESGKLVLSVYYKVNYGDEDGWLSSREEYCSVDCARMKMYQSYIHGFSYEEIYSNEVIYNEEGNVWRGFVGSYDDAGRLAESTYYESGEAELKVVYFYDENGRIEKHLEFQWGDGYEEYMETKDTRHGKLYYHEYENIGNEIKENVYLEGWETDYTEWIYDESMNIRSYKEVDGTKTEYGWEVNEKGKVTMEYTNAFIGNTLDTESVIAMYEYDYYENGNLKKESCYFSGVLKEYSEYYENGTVKEYKQFVYGDGEEEQKIRMHMTYNENGDETYHYEDVLGLVEYSCEYNEHGLLAKKVQKIHSEDAIVERETTWEYEYDEKGVVIKVSIYSGEYLEKIYE